MKPRLKHLLDMGGCSCHVNAPCRFCTGLDEDEFEAFYMGGMDALWKMYDENPKPACLYVKTSQDEKFEPFDYDEWHGEWSKE